jgi:CRISPR/Cas system endoribonuclease Cas6 (RAMP superfamily)
MNKGFDDSQFYQSVDYVLLERYRMANNSHFLDDARFEYTDHKRSSLVDKRILNRYQLAQVKFWDMKLSTSVIPLTLMCPASQVF